MALLLPGPPSSPTPTGGSDCLPCQAVRNVLTQCGTCGGGGGVPCPPGEHAAPCGPGECVDPQTRCCEPCSQLNACPCGGHPAPPNPGDVQNSCGCYVPAAATCPQGETPQPCGPGQAIDPQTNCCMPATQLGCPAGEHAQPCNPGETIDPQTNCCRAGACPQGEHAQPCQTGEQVDPQTGCCQPMPVEACFVCPGGLPELAAALQGQPNSCYLAGQFFLQPGALPPPAQA